VRQLDKLFDIIIASDDVKQGKPDPACYLLAAKRLEIKPENCVVFEDSFAGIEAGQSAGMKVIALATTNGKGELLKKTPNVIDGFNTISFNELEKML